MKGEEIPKIPNNCCDESEKNTIGSMLKEFYCRQMLSVVILVWFWAFIFIAGAVLCAIMFFDTDDTDNKIMFAAIFICCWYGLGLIKIFAWQIMHRNHTDKRIKKLELHIAELSSMLKNK